MKFVSIPYNDFIYEIFIYEMLCEIFVRGKSRKRLIMVNIERHQIVENVESRGKDIHEGAVCRLCK